MIEVRLEAIVDGGMPIEEVFHRDDHIGDVFQYEDDPIWYYRTPYSLMWWRTTDKDSGIKELMQISGRIRNITDI